MKVVIIEDEPYAVDRLISLLKVVQPQTEIVATLDSIQTSTDFFENTTDKIDLILTDVELADGLCFEIFNKVKIDFPIIFTTAYDQYAIKAFDLNSIHYLVKPVRQQDLQRALEKLTNRNNPSVADLSALKEVLNFRSKSYKSNFLAKNGSRFMVKHVDQISYFYTDDKLVYLVDASNKKYLIDNKLEELDGQALDPNNFFRVNRQFIVNIKFVELLKKYSSQRLQVFLSHGQEHEIIVSRERVSDFKNWLNK